MSQLTLGGTTGRASGDTESTLHDPRILTRQLTAMATNDKSIRRSRLPNVAWAIALLALGGLVWIVIADASVDQRISRVEKCMRREYGAENVPNPIDEESWNPLKCGSFLSSDHGNYEGNKQVETFDFEAGQRLDPERLVKHYKFRIELSRDDLTKKVAYTTWRRIEIGDSQLVP